MSQNPEKILVFRIGQLGDMIVALPALGAVRRYWPDAKLTLLCDASPGRKQVLGSEVFGPTGLFDSVEHYLAPSEGDGRVRSFARWLKLVLRLRAQRFDALIYLAPSLRKREQVRRDIAFFRAAGVSRVYGAGYFPPSPVKTPDRPFDEGPQEADLLLARLAADGIPVASPGEGSLDLMLGDAEAAAVAQWRATLASDGGRTWVGVGPGSKMPAKRWPLQRFGEVLDRLIARYDTWPVVFGGPEDRLDGDDLLARWGRGYNAAGALSVRESSMALKNCALFVGNDTGTMHLAAAAGAPCVAIFSARDWPGAWYPYGVARRVFRVPLDCEGCYLVECADRRNECLTRITVDEVIAGCEEFLKKPTICVAAVKS